MTTVRRILGAATHFETLGLPLKHLPCQEVRQSYMNLAKQVHPDQCRDPDASLAFLKVAAAYEALRCPQRRTLHLDFLRHQQQRDPRVALAAVDALAQPWLLGAFVGLFFSLELLRIAIADDDVPLEKEEPVVVVPSRTPVAPAFSSTPGKPLVGPSRDDLHLQLQQARAELLRKRSPEEAS